LAISCTRSTLLVKGLTPSSAPCVTVSSQAGSSGGGRVEVWAGKALWTT
jgi:hypothetical protein